MTTLKIIMFMIITLVVNHLYVNNVDGVIVTRTDKHIYCIEQVLVQDTNNSFKPGRCWIVTKDNMDNPYGNLPANTVVWAEYKL
jgi:hypothetical protein